jgi:hypothetical protein
MCSRNVSHATLLDGHVMQRQPPVNATMKLIDTRSIGGILVPRRLTIAHGRLQDHMVELYKNVGGPQK